jgi:hypothetical protein
MANYKKLSWMVQTPQLLKEALENNIGTGILQKPFIIFMQLLGEVADRAIELDDRELNKLMIRLGLYEITNPKSEDFDLKAA